MQLVSFDQLRLPDTVLGWQWKHPPTFESQHCGWVADACAKGFPGRVPFWWVDSTSCWMLRCFAAPFCHSFQESWSCHRSAWKASWKPFRISRRRRRRRKHSNNYRRMPAQHSFNQRFGWIWQVSLQYVNMHSQSMCEVDTDTMILMILVGCSKCNFDVLWAAWASSWSHPRWITSLGKDVMASKVWALHLVTRDLF